MLPDAEVERHLQTAGALIYTSRLEPFGLVPLEANACGLPVVAVAEGGVRETVKDGINGILSDPSPAALAKALEELLDNPEKWDLLGASARTYVVENWGTGNAARALESFLLGVAENSRPGSNKA
jgi:glycosyltransferase involved in cell wall biosynthesis